jgi:hypothetical protein
MSERLSNIEQENSNTVAYLNHNRVTKVSQVDNSSYEERNDNWADRAISSVLMLNSCVLDIALTNISVKLRRLCQTSRFIQPNAPL